MYLPKSFEETRVDVLHDLIRAHPLGTLVTLSKDGLDANHIPFEIEFAGAVWNSKGARRPGQFHLE